MAARHTSGGTLPGATGAAPRSAARARRGAAGPVAGGSGGPERRTARAPLYVLSQGWRVILLSTTALTGVAIVSLPARGADLPTGGQFISGGGTIATTGTQMNVNTTTDATVMQWGSFGIGSGYGVRFNQPGTGSVVVNRIGGGQSMILGSLSSNGQVVLINADGIVFGQGSRVDVNGLVATTATPSNLNTLGTAFTLGDLRFDLPSANALASIVNEGTITIGQGGMAALVAPTVANRGMIVAPLGKVVLAGADTFALDPFGDKLIRFDVGTPSNLAKLVHNSGVITADGGRVVLTAQGLANVARSVINMDGKIEARSVGVQNGTIVLDGGQNSEIRIAGTLDASGRGAGEAGGTISVLGSEIRTAQTAVLDASGTTGGGKIQLSADAQAFLAGTFKVEGAGGTVAVASQGDLTVADATVKADTITLAADSDRSGTITGGGGTAWLENAWLDASSVYAQGGRIEVTGNRVGLAGLTVADASGATGGGAVYVGGDYLGGGTIRTAAQTYIGSDVVIRANALGAGDGGRVIVWADDFTRYLGAIEAKGGALGGDGGFVETSGKNTLVALGSVTTAAAAGKSGLWFLDPVAINIMNATDANLSNVAGVFDGDGTTAGSILDNGTLQAALAAGNVEVRTTNGTGGAGTGNIAVSTAVTWSSGNQLFLNATDNVDVNAAITANTGSGGSLRVTAGAGNFTLSAAAPINVTGAVNITAGQNITFNHNVFTNGGNLLANATGGAILQAAGSAFYLAGGQSALRAATGIGNGTHAVTFDGTSITSTVAASSTAGDVRLAAINSVNLTVGSVDGLNGVAAGGAVAINTDAGTETVIVSQAVTAGGNVSIFSASSGDIFVNANLRSGGAGAVEVVGTGGIISGIGTIDLTNSTGGARLATSGAGSVGNVGTALAISSDGDTIAATAGTAGVNLTVTGGNVTVGSINGTTGVSAMGNVRIAASNNVTVANNVTTTAGTGNVTISATDNVTITAEVAASGATQFVNISSANGSIVGTGSVNLTNAGGGAALHANTTIGGVGTAAQPINVTTTAANSTIAGSAGSGGFFVNTSANLTVGTVNGTSGVTTANGGNITLRAGSGDLAHVAGTITAANVARLVADGFNLTLGAGTVTGQSILVETVTAATVIGVGNGTGGAELNTSELTALQATGAAGIGFGGGNGTGNVLVNTTGFSFNENITFDRTGGQTVISGNQVATTAGNISFADVVNVTNATVNVNTSGGNVVFGANITANGANNLAVNAGAGTVSIANAVGNGTALGNFNVTAATIDTDTSGSNAPIVANGIIFNAVNDYTLDTELRALTPAPRAIEVLVSGGSILDTGGLLNMSSATSGALRLVASNGIGNATNLVNISVDDDGFAASAGAGGAFINHTGALLDISVYNGTTGLTATGAGTIRIESAGAVNFSQLVSTGGGDILVNATGNIDQNSTPAERLRAGTGNIALRSTGGAVGAAGQIGINTTGSFAASAGAGIAALRNHAAGTSSIGTVNGIAGITATTGINVFAANGSLVVNSNVTTTAGNVILNTAGSDLVINGTAVNVTAGGAGNNVSLFSSGNVTGNGTVNLTGSTGGLLVVAGAGGGIGNAAQALTVASDGDNIALSGGTGGINLTGAGDLTIQAAGGLNNVTSTGGNVTLQRTSGHLTIAAGQRIQASGAGVTEIALGANGNFNGSGTVNLSNSTGGLRVVTSGTGAIGGGTALTITADGDNVAFSAGSGGINVSSSGGILNVTSVTGALGTTSGAAATTVGNISIAHSGSALNIVQNVSTGTGHVTLNGGGGGSGTNLAAQVTTGGAGNINVTALGGGLIVLSNATVNLTTGSGNITLGNATNANVAGAAGLNATTTGNITLGGALGGGTALGAVNLSGGNLALLDITTQNANVTLAASGGAVNITGLLIATGTGKIKVDALNDITIGELRSSNTSADAVNLTTTAGSILDGDANAAIDINVTGGGARLRAFVGIGSGANGAIETDIAAIDAGVTNPPSAGGINIAEISAAGATANITIAGAHAGSGPLTVTSANGSVLLGGNVSTRAGVINFTNLVIVGNSEINSTNGSAAGADINLIGTTQSSGGAHSLTLVGGTAGIVSLGNATAAAQLGNGTQGFGVVNVASAARVDVNGTVFTQGTAFNLASATEVRLHGASTFNSTVGGGGGLVSLANVTATGAHDATIIAGTAGASLRDLGNVAQGIGNLTVNGTGGSTLNGTIRTQGGAGVGTVSLNGPVTLAGATVINTTAGNGGTGASATLNGTVDGAMALTMNLGTTGDARFNGTVGGTTALTAVNVAAANHTFIGNGTNVDVNTTGAQNYASAITVNADLRTTGGAGNINVAGATNVNGASTIVATGGGSIGLAGAVNGASTLSMTATGASINLSSTVSNLTGFTITAAAGTNLTGAVNIAGPVSITSDNVNVSADIRGTSLQINTLAAGIDLVGGATDINFTATGGNIVLGGALDGAKNLNLSATGSIDATALNVGATTAPTTLVAAAGTQIGVAVVRTAGDQTYSAPTVQLGQAAGTAANLSTTGAGNITVNGNVSLPATTANVTNITTTNGNIAIGNGTHGAITGSVNGTQALNVSAGTAGSNVTLTQGIGNATLGLGNVTLTTNGAGRTLANGSIFTAGNATAGLVQVNGALFLDNAVTVNTVVNGTVGGNVVFNGTVNSNNTGRALTVIAGTAGDVAFNGNVGSTLQLASLTVTSSDVLAIGNAATNVVNTTGAQTYNATGASSINGTLRSTAAGGDITVNASATLQSAVTVDTSTGNGNVTFGNGTVGTLDGGQTLAVTAGTGNVTFNRNVGATTALTSIAVTGTTTTVGNATNAVSTNTTGVQAYAGNLSANGTLRAGGNVNVSGNTTLTGTAGATTFNSTGGGVGLVGAATGAGQGLTVLAAATAQLGNNVSVGGAVNFTAAAIQLFGDVNTTAGGILMAGPVTLNAATTNVVAGTGAVNFTGTVNGVAANAHALNVSAAAGNATFGGAVGGGAALTGLTAAAGGAGNLVDIGGAVAVRDSVSFTSNGTITLDQVVTTTNVTGATIVMNSTSGAIANGGGSIAMGAGAGDQLALRGATGVGAAGAPIDIAGVETLAAAAPTSGDVDVRQNTAATLTAGTVAGVVGISSTAGTVNLATGASGTLSLGGSTISAAAGTVNLSADDFVFAGGTVSGGTIRIGTITVGRGLSLGLDNGAVAALNVTELATLAGGAGGIVFGNANLGTIDVAADISFTENLTFNSSNGSTNLTRLFANLTTTGAQDIQFLDAVTVNVAAASVTTAGGNVTLGGTVTAASAGDDLTLSTGGGRIIGNGTGNISALGSLDLILAGANQLQSNVTVAGGNFAATGALTLLQDVSIVTGGGTANFTSVAGAQALNVSTGAGLINVTGAIATLTSVNMASTGGIAVASVTTTGNQNYTGNLTTAAGATLSSTGAGLGVTGTLTGTGASTMTTAGGPVSVGGNVSTAGAFSVSTGGGALTLSGTHVNTTAGGAVTLNAGAGVIAVANNINSTGTVAMTTTGGITVGGNLTSTGTSVTAGGGTFALSGKVLGGATTFTNDVTLTQSLTTNGTAVSFGGNLNLGGTPIIVDTTNGQNGLAVNFGAVVSVAGAITTTAGNGVQSFKIHAGNGTINVAGNVGSGAVRFADYELSAVGPAAGASARVTTGGIAFTTGNQTYGTANISNSFGGGVVSFAAAPDLLPGGTLTVNGTLLITADQTLAPGNYLDIGSATTGAFNLTLGNGTYNFTGSGPSVIGTSVGAVSFAMNDVVMANGTIINTAGGGINANGNVTIDRSGTSLAAATASVPFSVRGNNVVVKNNDVGGAIAITGSVSASDSLVVLSSNGTISATAGLAASKTLYVASGDLVNLTDTTGAAFDPVGFSANVAATLYPKLPAFRMNGTITGSGFSAGGSMSLGGTATVNGLNAGSLFLAGGGSTITAASVGGQSGSQAASVATFLSGTGPHFLNGCELGTPCGGLSITPDQLTANTQSISVGEQLRQSFDVRAPFTVQALVGGISDSGNEVDPLSFSNSGNEELW